MTNRTCKIIDGRAYTDGDTALITDLPFEEQQAVFKWIKNNLIHRNSPNLCYTSYGLKHILERDLNIYLTNNQFKDAMLMCEFFPVDHRNVNWCYFISQKSPALAISGREV